MPRGASSGDELAIETITTGACWPWNLSTVPDGEIARGGATRSVRTCALYGATTSTSRTVSGRSLPSTSVNVVPTSARTAAAIASASSTDDCPRPVCSTGSQTGPFPAASDRRAASSA